MKGFNAETGKIEDLIEVGVVDASTIVLGAIRNALGIASTLLTTYSVLIIPPPSQHEMLNQMALRPVAF